MKRSALILAVALMALSSVADAGYSGGSRGGFSSGGSRSYSSPSSSRSYSAPSYSRPSPTPSFSAPATPRPQVAPTAPPVANRGGFNSQASRAPAPTAPPVANRGGFNSSQTPPRTAQTMPNGTRTTAPRTATTTTTTTSTTVNRSSSYGGRFVSPGGYYGGWGMGYGYNNGFLTGLIIGNMMHPHGTVWYTGPGYYSNNAVVYPDGRVVDQRGVVVGTYVGGVFTPVTNGAVVAQAVPADAMNNGTYQSSTQPVVLVKTGPSAWEIAGTIVLGIFSILLLIMIVAAL